MLAIIGFILFLILVGMSKESQRTKRYRTKTKNKYV
jgi:hypothetical protein